MPNTKQNRINLPINSKRPEYVEGKANKQARVHRRARLDQVRECEQLEGFSTFRF
jgi:hypothetical protein